MTFLNFNSGRIRVPRWQNSLQIARVPRKTTKTKFTLFKMWLSNINISEVLDMLTSGWTGFRHSTVFSLLQNWLQALRGGQILDQFVESRQSHVSYCLHNRQCKQLLKNCARKMYSMIQFHFNKTMLCLILNNNLDFVLILKDLFMILDDFKDVFRYLIAKRI